MSSRLSRIHSLVLAAALGMGAVAISVPAHAEVPNVGKVAMVDMKRVFDETEAGKKAKSTLEDSARKKLSKFEKRQEKLEAEQSKLKNLQGEQLAAAQGKLEQDYYELQSMYMTMQQELAQQEAKAVEEFYAACQGVVSDIAKAGGLDLVLVRGEATVLYAKDSLDITNDVIKAYDRQRAK